MAEKNMLQIQSMQDLWSKLYLYLARMLTADGGIAGEKALREGVRNFGADRGRAAWEKHRRLGMKRNLIHLFSCGDVPDDARFRRDRKILTATRRYSEVLFCPIAAMWEEMNGKDLGRVYCEEFHHAKFTAYAPHIQVNLARTLTQDGDDRCCFSEYLRPANMTAEERKEAFPEYDPKYRAEMARPYSPGDPQVSFHVVCVKLYYHLAQSAAALFKEDGWARLRQTLREAALDMKTMLNARAKAYGVRPDQDFFAAYTPFLAKVDDLWTDYGNQPIRKLYEENLVAPLQNAFVRRSVL